MDELLTPKLIAFPLTRSRRPDKIYQLPPLSAQSTDLQTAIVGGPTTHKGLRALSRGRHCITNRLPNTCWQQLMQILINNMQCFAVHQRVVITFLYQFLFA